MFKLTFISFVQLISLLGGFFAPLSAAMFHTIDTTFPLLCTFSSKYQNRVMVEKGKVQKVIAADEGHLSIFMDELSGQAFIYARDQDPKDTTLSIVTETGLVQDLQVTFIERLPEVIILSNPTFEQKEDGQEEMQEKVAEHHVLAKVDDILMGNIPGGYIPCQVKHTRWQPKKGITLEALAQLEGSDEILTVYQVTNTSCEQKSLSEYELQCQDCRWVFLETNTLLSKQKILGRYCGAKMISQTKKILKTQKKHALVVAGISLLILFGIGHLMFQDASPALHTKAAKVELPVDKVNVQDIWMNRQDSVLTRLESEGKIADQKMKMLEELILSNKKKEEENEKENLKLKKTMTLLQQDLKGISSKLEEVKNQEIAYQEPISQPISPSFSPPTLSESNPFVSPSANRFFSSVIQSPSSVPLEEMSPLRAPLREYSIQAETRTVFSVDDVVPAAVSVKALLVSSVDAICGVYANSDPVPVKLRLLDDAHLPKGVTVKLKGCLVLASAYGNISNERVYMRLERLTQVNTKGEAIETEVVGYVSGEDGKFGVEEQSLIAPQKS